MIHCVLGTRAQLVKMAPLIVEFEKRGWPINLIHTGQHYLTVENLCEDFNIKAPWRSLGRNSEAITIFESLKWFIAILYDVVFRARKLIPNASKNTDVVLIHGDTFSTVMGAILGKLAGATVAHVESGLRSFNIFEPFPEEINRLITFQLMDIGFCPGDWAKKNLLNYKQKELIDTKHNTLIDSLHYAIGADNTDVFPENQGQYCVVSIHRFENIFSRKRLARIINLVLYTANKITVLFVLHPVTQKRLLKTRAFDRLVAHPKIRLRQRTGYFEFIKLIGSSLFVITDGGSNQEELTYLGIPTLLIRKNTERQEGLKSCVTLSYCSEEIEKKFIESQLEKGRSNFSTLLPISESPSKKIAIKLNRFITSS